MELQQRDIIESNQSAEPALSSAQSPPYTPTASSAYTGPAAAAEYAEEKLVKLHLTDFAEESRAELMCAFCERDPAKWKDCPHAECKGQAWCNDCNTRWHTRNPKRKQHRPTRVLESEAKSPARNPAKTPVTEVQGSHQDDGPPLSSAASAAPTAVISASSPRVCPSLTYLAELCDDWCYCIGRTPDGRLLVGRDDSLEIRAPDGKLLLSRTRVEGPVAGACQLMGKFYLLIYKLHRRISVRDGRSLKEISSWPLPGCIWPTRFWDTNLAVLGQTLVVPDPDHSRLLVYSSEGKLLPQHAVSGKPHHLVSSGTDIIVSDWWNGIVSVYDTSSSPYKLKFTYAGLELSTAVAVGSDGHLYLGSLIGDNKLHMLSATGQLIAELHDKRLGECRDLNITGDQLLAATESGLYLYKLEK